MSIDLGRRFALCLLPTVFLVGCKQDTSTSPSAAAVSSPTISIGVSLLTKTHPFYKDLEQGMRAAASKAGLELKVQSAEFDTATQTAQLENFITQKVSAIVVCPVDSQAVGGAIRQANEAKIPVFTADIRSAQGAIVSHIATDNRQGGHLIGDYLAKALGGKGKVAAIDHPEVASSQERMQGFTDALKAYPGIQLVAQQSGSGVRDRAATTMENLLQAHPDLNGVFAINDNTALGVISVLQARGKKDVIVVGFDADSEGRAAIQKGLLLADAAQSPDEIGTTTVQTVIDYLHHKPVKKEVAIPSYVLDKPALEKLR